MALQALSVKVQASFYFGVSLAAASRTINRVADDMESSTCSLSLSLGLGSTGAASANKLYSDKRTLSASASEKLNVSGGAAAAAIALLNPCGEAVTFAKIICLMVLNCSSTGSLTLFGDATYDITTMLGANGDIISVRPGAAFLLCCNARSDNAADSTFYAVATDEVLKVANLDGSNPLSYECYIAGQ